MRLLFVKLKHIGDALLLTPTLTAARQAYPDAEIWVVVRKGCEGILAGCPAIDRLLTTAAPEAGNRSVWNWVADLKLLFHLSRQRFDYAFELSDGDRGRWLAGFSGARNRCANEIETGMPGWWRLRFNRLSRFAWENRHRVEKDFFTVHEFLPLSEPVPPLCFSPEKTQTWNGPLQLSEYAVLHPGTRWKRKRWPAENWVTLMHRLQTQFPQLIISVGPDREERRLAEQLHRESGHNIVSTDGRLNWAQLAGLLRGAQLFVGVDTAAMHLAAACGVPSVVLFGPSVESAWRPWRVAHELITPQLPDVEVTRPDGVIDSRLRPMDQITVDQVWSACRRLLEEVSPQ